MEKVEVKKIVFLQDAKDIRKDSFGKIIPEGTEMVCTGKALELFLKAKNDKGNVAKLVTDSVEEKEIKKDKK